MPRETMKKSKFESSNYCSQIGHDATGSEGSMKAEQEKRLFMRTFLRTAIGNASNSSSVVRKPVMSLIFFRKRPDGRLRVELTAGNDCA